LTSYLGVELTRLFPDVHHHGAGFEDAYRFSAIRGRAIDQRGHAVVGTDCQEVILELVTAADVAGHNAIFHRAFFQQNRDLLAVRRRPIVQIDHGRSPCAKSLA
jgi:hypothetical protein